MSERSESSHKEKAKGSVKKLLSFARYATSCAKAGSGFVVGALILSAKTKKAERTGLLNAQRNRARLAVTEAWKDSVDAGLGAMRGVQLGFEFNHALPGVAGASRAVAFELLHGGEAGVAKVAESIEKARSKVEVGSLVLGLTIAWLMATSKSGAVFGESRVHRLSEQEGEAFESLSSDDKSRAIHSAAMLLPAASRRVMEFERPWEIVHAFNDNIDLMGRDPKVSGRGGDLVLRSLKASLVECDIGFVREWAKFGEYASSGMGKEAKDWAGQVVAIMEQKKEMEEAMGSASGEPARSSKRSASL